MKQQLQRARRGAILVGLTALALACHGNKDASDAKGDGGGKGERSADAKGGDAGKGEGKGGGKGEGKGGGGGRNGPAPVRIAEVQKKIAPRLVTTVSVLNGRVQADVYSKVIGRITFMGPKEGEKVRAGETLFRVDRSDPGDTFLNAPVVSPISGWVGRWRVVNIGEQVSPSDPVVTVLDDAALRATVYLPTEDWIDVHQDTKVTATVNANGEERPAKIETIARSADSVSARGAVTIQVDNPKRDWRAGVYATLKFEVDPRERVLVSAASVVITDQGAYVYVADGDKAKRVKVNFRLIDSDTIEILSGLDLPAKVVTAGVNLLGDQSPIRIVD